MDNAKKIIKDIKKLNSEKSIKRLDNFYHDKFEYFNHMYFVIVGSLNRNLFSTSLNFYLSCIDNLERLHNSLKFVKKSLKDNIKDNIAGLNEYKNNLSSEYFIKIEKHLNNEIRVFSKYLKKIEYLYNLILRTIEFIQKQIIDLHLIYSLNTNFNFIAIYSAPIKELKITMDKNNYAIPEELKFMFTELNYLSKNKNNFVILTKKDVKLLKKYSKELNLNLDFPIFETEKSNFVSFNKGKMDTVFPEFTNML